MPVNASMSVSKAQDPIQNENPQPEILSESKHIIWTISAEDLQKPWAKKKKKEEV